MKEDSLKHSMQVLLNMDVHSNVLESLSDHLSEGQVLLRLITLLNVPANILNFKISSPTSAPEPQIGLVVVWDHF